MVEDVEYDVNELPDSYFSKAAARVFDKIDNGKDGFLPLSKFVDLIEIPGGGGCSEDLTGRLRKLYKNESGSLGRFAYVRWYVEEDVSLESTEESERLVGWG